MSDFYSETHVKKTRKDHRCDGCCKPIPAGSQALRYSGKFDGQFGTFVHHPECREAECALNKLHRSPYDEWLSLSDIESDKYEWLLAEFPIVAERFGITAQSIAEHEREREESRRAWAEIDRKRRDAQQSARHPRQHGDVATRF